MARPRAARPIRRSCAATTAERLRTAVALEKPDVVLWQVGTNDALARVDPADFEETIRSTISWLKASDIDVVLVGLQYTPKVSRDDSYFAIRQSLKKVAASENVLYVNRYSAMQFIAAHQASDNLVSGDGLHLNPAGYQALAEAVEVKLFGK